MNKFYSLVTILIILSSSCELYSQWEKVSGKFGGYVNSIIEKDGSIFAGSEGFGVFVSRDNGLSWEASDSGLVFNYIHNLLKDGSDIYAAAFGGIIWSSDNGKSWVQRDSGIVSKNIYSLASNDSYIFAGTDEGAYRSSDKGLSWVEIDTGLGIVDSILIIEKSTSSFLTKNRYDYNPGSVKDTLNLIPPNVYSIAAVGATIYCLTNYGLCISENNGNTWEKMNIQPPYGPMCFSVYESGLLMGTDYGIYSLSKQDTAWIAKSFGLTGKYIIAIESKEDLILASTFDSLFLSTNNGVSWKNITCGLTRQEIRTINIDEGKLFAGSEEGGVYVYNAEADCWSTLNVGLTSTYVYSVASTDEAIFIGTESGIYTSDNNGKDWHDISTGLPGPRITQVGIHNNYLFASAYNLDNPVDHILYRSSDYGNTWVPVTNGIDNTNGISSFASYGSYAFVGGGYGLYRSSNNGNSWEDISTGINGPYVITLAVGETNDGGKAIYAGTVQSGAYRSTDYGSHWNKISNGITSNNISAFAAKGPNVFAGSGHGNGIFVSNDFGLTWQVYNNGLISNYVFAFALTDTNVFTGTQLGGGVYLSRYEGNGWKEVNDGFEDASINDLHIKGNYLFAATSQGVWRRPLNEMTTSISDEINSIPAKFKLEQNYPNPFNPITNIEYSVPSGAENVTLKIYDVLGNEITTLVNEVKNAGTYQVSFNASKLSSGVYFYSLQSGSFKQTKKFILMK